MSEPDRMLSAAGAVSEPERVLIAAGVEALRPFVRSLRKMGWAAEITAHSQPLKVTLDIDLTGLKRPAQETDPELRPVLPGPHIKPMSWSNEHTDAKGATQETDPE